MLKAAHRQKGLNTLGGIKGPLIFKDAVRLQLGGFVVTYCKTLIVRTLQGIKVSS
jgi:hypothetical protein